METENTVRLNVEMSREQHAALKAACALDHTTIKAKLLELVQAYIDSKAK